MISHPVVPTLTGISVRNGRIGRVHANDERLIQRVAVSQSFTTLVCTNTRSDTINNFCQFCNVWIK